MCQGYYTRMIRSGFARSTRILNLFLIRKRIIFILSVYAPAGSLKTIRATLSGGSRLLLTRRRLLNSEQPTGGCGFFECIDNQQAADLLFDTAKNWLKQQGMEAMDGPINFGENDMWWGLLVEGFSRPYYGMNYNPPYYKRLFEHYGFKVLYEQISNKLVRTKTFSGKIL